MMLTKSQRLKAEIHNMHLLKGISFTEKYGFPQLKPYNGLFKPEELIFVPFSSRNEQDFSSRVVISFFEDDYKFAHATWKRLDQTTYKLRKYTTLLTPDHSLYVDMPDAFNIAQIYKSRFAGAFWQQCGFHVIATASWGNADSFKYCFEGLPSNSIIAVCGIGVDWCAAAKELWCMGIRELINQVSPSLIIVNGNKRYIPGVNTPMIFIPPYTQTKFNHGKGKRTVASR